MPDSTVIPDSNLAERLQTLETRFDILQRPIEEQLPPGSQRERRGWLVIVGTFANDLYYDEAMRLGQQWRASQHDQQDEDAA